MSALHFGVPEVDSNGKFARAHELQREGYCEIGCYDCAQDRPTRIDAMVQGPAAVTAGARLRDAVGQPVQYHLAKLNCDTFARWVMCGAAESAQAKPSASL